MKTPVRWTMPDTHFDAYYVKNAISSELHGHRHFLLTLITRGEGIQKLNGVDTPFKKGDLFLLSPIDFHENHIERGKSYDYYGIKFNFEMLDSRLSAIFGNNTLPLHLSLPDSAYKKASELFFELVHKTTPNLPPDIVELYEKVLLEQLLILVMHYLPQNLEKPQNLFAVRILGYIYSHFSEQISVPKAASYFGYTPNHFNARFCATFGAPFNTYLRAMRLEYAKNLVLTGELPITEIAFESGFSSLAHFSRSFKEKYGTSPQQYKKN